ncbi:MAG: peptide ABC transporter substrate-binding protein [Cyanobacteria bacterium]|nr:peptide ABC transporter substrate-binding protein [Cyanobacteria bacterium CG_2015-16_32_12]NCO78792.1 peptide ABC transporter substrate-binding protein [Cyanobacteria bacterium CG_2015-22_32_23]NCQ04704.1 peptide ABC transporter substrate-binding protein [Cyanobacteria bacterium CG_2015-09_32_10]NCQ40344.1 peptide ABC transporter substrate-binding protein [Cyanobacteria bacterium CG_2015-04_32_10]NCS86099.1 peptide ABC transporter substrate-binding protein [Cyanobacteria bacterium CG_2015-0
MRKIRKSRVNLILAVSSCLTVISCNSPSAITENNNPTTSDTDNNKILKMIYWQAPTILNPHLSTGFKDSEASRITLEPLATFDSDSKLIPVLAQIIPSVENGGVAKDGLSVTWKLRQDVKWSDGEKFTASDVVFTYQFINNPKVGSVNSGDYAVVKNVEALDEYTVKITFKQVTPAWYSVFVGGAGMILPEHLYAQYNGENAREAPFNLLPVGTGGYAVSQFKPGDSVIYQKNPYYRQPETLNFEKIEIKGGGDATSAARAVLQTGDADFAYNLQVESNILDELSKANKGKIITNFGSNSERILLNYTDPNKETPEGERSSVKFPHPFFSNVKVRQAFALAVDKNTIAEQLYGITGKPTSNFLLAPPEFVSTNTTSEFNLDKAGKLLDEAGWKDTNGNGIRDKDGVEMKVLFQTTVNPLRQKTQAIIKQNWESLGIEVELKSIDASVMFSSDPSNNDTVEHFSADVQMFTTGNNNPDPTPYFKVYTCNNIPQKSNNWSGDNYSRYCNPEYDQLLQTVITELNPEKRAIIFKQLNDLLIENVTVIPIIHRADVVGIANNLQGVSLTAWDLRTWNITQWKKIN